MFSLKTKEYLTLTDKLILMNWGLVLLIIIIGGIGAGALYSAANGNIEPYASNHLIRFGIGIVGLLITAFIDIKFWRMMAWPIYGIVLLLLIIVEVKGYIGMGAQRWIDLGFIKLQPSELMKIALIMALSSYFYRIDSNHVTSFRHLALPILATIIPVALVLKQPDLGTAFMLTVVGGAILFLAGVRWWLFVGGLAAAGAAVPVLWTFLHDYQKNRILTFLNPEADPLGTGYHVTQSKIALGSGGIHGKGFLNGTQSHLNFLPEKQTDFIFTLWAEEWGLIGSVLLLSLFMATFTYGIVIALKCRSQFSRLLVMGLVINIALYVFINTAMVMGLIPVVGVPLPLVSYGGTAMLSTLFAYGLILSASIHRDTKAGLYY